MTLGMPSIAGLNTSPRASRKVISDYIDSPDSGSAAAHKPFTSALDAPSLRPTPRPRRRRGSDGDSPRSRDSSNLHARFSSMDSPCDPHPLRRSSTTTKTPRYDTASTRPRLSRILSPSTPTLARPPSNPPSPDQTGSHRTVLAHEVSPNDTLAGVALKYGISVTELRRANQLWASDSIHLRQVLYVPLDKAHHADLDTVASLLAQRTDNEDIAAPPSHLDLRTADPAPIVQRIPSTSLSFFPPPLSRPSTPPLPGGAPFPPTTPFHSHSQSPGTTSSTPSKGPNLASSLGANALSSLFSILPINASTRDEIMSRLSIDSVSNSTTGTASDEAEHELTAVPTAHKSRTNASVSNSAPLTTNLQRKRKGPKRTWLSESTGCDGHREQYPPRDRDVEQITRASSPIHTTQMQPAAAMKLPEYMTRSPSKAPPPPNDPHNSTWRPSDSDHRRIR
ncbi:hypothetical protein BJV74DRAFT_88927 [Russula compacta]|nr:hypothetical protein BJV74DRAFT_88927 [Russula compacta]